MVTLNEQKELAKEMIAKKTKAVVSVGTGWNEQKQECLTFRLPEGFSEADEAAMKEDFAGFQPPVIFVRAGTIKFEAK